MDVLDLKLTISDTSWAIGADSCPERLPCHFFSQSDTNYALNSKEFQCARKRDSRITTLEKNLARNENPCPALWPITPAAPRCLVSASTSTKKKNLIMIFREKRDVLNQCLEAIQKCFGSIAQESNTCLKNQCGGYGRDGHPIQKQRSVFLFEFLQRLLSVRNNQTFGPSKQSTKQEKKSNNSRSCF